MQLKGGKQQNLNCFQTNQNAPTAFAFGSGLYET